MPVLQHLKDDGGHPQLKEMFDEVLSRWPRVPNLYRTLGHQPDILRGWVDLAWSLRLKAGTSRRVRELIILKGARVSETEYEWVHHVPMALEAAWKRRLVVFSSNPLHVKRGTLFALYPDHELMGSALADLAIRQIQGNPEPQILPHGFEQRGEHAVAATDDIDATLGILGARAVALDELHISTPTLDDLFLKLTGHGLRES